MFKGEIKVGGRSGSPAREGLVLQWVDSQRDGGNTKSRFACATWFISLVGHAKSPQKVVFTHIFTLPAVVRPTDGFKELRTLPTWSRLRLLRQAPRFALTRPNYVASGTFQRRLQTRQGFSPPFSKAKVFPSAVGKSLYQNKDIVKKISDRIRS